MKIHIQEAWWSAWQKFGWAKGIWGIGIDAKKVDQAIEDKDELFVRIGKFIEEYCISPTTVKNFAEKNGTTYKAKGKLLYVIPQTVLKKVCKN